MHRTPWPPVRRIGAGHLPAAHAARMVRSANPSPRLLMAASPRVGLLLLNLGTPDSPHPPDVRRYLREFLNDPRVLDINPVVRTMLLEGVILRTRPKASGEAYETVWTDRGSPLLFHTLDLADGVRELLGDAWQVEVAMRYQSPSIEKALESFRRRGVDRIVVFPLFPQYASSTTGSAAQKVTDIAHAEWNTPSLCFVEAFYDHPAFIDAFVRVARPVLDTFGPDHVLLSYHGLPERHVRKSDESAGGWCLADGACCERLNDANRNCYRAQCFATSRGLIEALRLDPASVDTTFQSRLGRDPWIQPYTDETVERLAKQGVKRLAVLCPAFVADCLETIEEIGDQAREAFVEAGGDDLVLVPSLNASAGWIEGVAAIARDHAPPAWVR